MSLNKIELMKELGINIEEVVSSKLVGNKLIVKFETGHTVKFKITRNVSKV